MTAKIGFIGLGSMGSPIARRLVEGGFRLVVFDVRADVVESQVGNGIRRASSVQDVADQCEIVFTCLPDISSTRAVAVGPSGIGQGRRVRLLVNLGTTGSPLSREIEAALSQRSIVMLDAPMSGGVRGATLGTLSVMCSGPREAFQSVEKALGCFGSKVVFVGTATGVAQTMKLANNLISLGAFLLTGEALAMGVKAGLDPNVMLDVINAGTGRNTATTDKFPRHVLTRSFALGATTEVAAKDVRLAIAEAEALGVPVWVGNMVHQFFTFALSQGEGPKDYTRLVELVEHWAGIEIRGGDSAASGRTSAESAVHS